MKKKAILLLALFIMMVCFGVTAYGDEWDKNQDVAWLYVNGINLNSVDETRTVDGVTYNASDNILTLNNCNITVSNVNFIDYSGDIPLNVEIKGNNIITGMEEEGRYNLTFIDCESYTDGADSSVNIYGGGTIALNKINHIVSCYILEESRNSKISINNVRMNAIGGGIQTFYGNVNIENATIRISDRAGKGASWQLRAGIGLDSANGNVNIKNSIVELQSQKIYTWYDEVLMCRNLNVNGLNIYAGGTSAQWKANVNSLLEFRYDDGTKSTKDYIGYVLITPEKKKLPDISIAKDTHTSTYTRGKKAATYFTYGYTGDKVCNVCGKITSYGKNIAKKKLGKPSVKAGKRRITVKYKKISGATGFQIRYKKAKGKWIIKKYKENKNCSKIFKKLKKGKKYSVQIRVMKGSAYSDWSKTKTVKVK